METDIKSLISDAENCLLAVDRIGFSEIGTRLSSEHSPLFFAEKILVPALGNIGNAWEAGACSLSQVYMSGRLSEDLINKILPAAGSGEDDESKPSIGIAILNDHHFLGKRLVASVLRSSGIQMMDYGATGVSELAEAALRDKLDILLVSTLMLPSALDVRDLVVALRKNGATTKVVVGGAPFLMDKNLWQEVGADAMGRTASDAIGIVGNLTGGAR